ncbi:hypothetical protein H072_11538 [Dactylellina haptotyla CBS 200.50]|uniref:Uncharacterized protein n=1 Tax=Dactylellina haptotyla (strain CBS 200.50) TaxID=1284197 RepID=S8B7W1_DACHA|nr:hypothetical protein H072_11538 [Dactylellina haptotyla CBS 200.50]
MSTEAVETSKPSVKVELYNYYTSSDKKPLSSLSADDLETVTKAITKVLKSVAAQKSLPNLIEGPDYSVDERGWSISLEPPPEVPSQILTKFSKAVDAFDLQNLQVNSRVLEQYSSASHASYKEHRLLEIICAAIHAIAIDIYTTNNPPPEVVNLDSLIPAPYPVIAHSQYYASKPWKKVFDLKAVGFWAEAQIFGGVLYFDRAFDDSQPELNAYQGVWVHGLPYAYTESLWHVPDEVVTTALESAKFPFDIAAAQDVDSLLGLKEAEEEHGIFRHPKLANEEAYTGEHSDEVQGLSDEDLAELQALREKAKESA